jgi:type I restriction-modification system DNA methylase subunit
VSGAEHMARARLRRGRVVPCGAEVATARYPAINELTNETAGDHFTPRELIRLMGTSTPEIDADLKLAEEEISGSCRR